MVSTLISALGFTMILLGLGIAYAQVDNANVLHWDDKHRIKMIKCGHYIAFIGAGLMVVSAFIGAALGEA